MPPRHDFRGGKQSDDSFATSRNTFVASTIRCLFAAGSQWIWDYNNGSFILELDPIPVPLALGGRFPRMADIVWSLLWGAGRGSSARLRRLHDEGTLQQLHHRRTVTCQTVMARKQLNPA